MSNESLWQDKFSVIYCTCDAYEDLWDNFFVLLKRHWHEFKGKIYFNAERKKYFNTDYDIINVPHADSFSWSDRLADTLKIVDTEYVLLILDDFYLYSDVNHNKFAEVVKTVSASKNVKAITFKKVNGVKLNTADRIIDGFSQRKRFCLYKVNAQITLYKTDFLLNNLRRKETAWEFETSGTFRSFFKGGKFLCATSDENCIFSYDGGALVIRGKYKNAVKTKFETQEGIVFPEGRETVESIKNRPSLLRKFKYPIKAIMSFFKKKC